MNICIIIIIIIIIIIRILGESSCHVSCLSRLSSVEALSHGRAYKIS
jgi:hypothetical protein